MRRLKGNTSATYLAFNNKNLFALFYQQWLQAHEYKSKTILFSSLPWKSSTREKCDWFHPTAVTHCTASCSLILPDHKNKSTSTASAVKWHPEDILIKGVWHLNMFASLHAGTGAPCTVHPLPCTSGEFGCAWCRPKSSLHAATFSQSSLNWLRLKLTEVSYMCVCVLHSHLVMAVNTLRCWRTSHSSCEVLSTLRHKQKRSNWVWGENPARILVYFMMMSHFSETDLKIILDSFNFLSHLKPPKTLDYTPPCKSHAQCIHCSPELPDKRFRIKSSNIIVSTQPLKMFDLSLSLTESTLMKYTTEYYSWLKSPGGLVRSVCGVLCVAEASSSPVALWDWEALPDDWLHHQLQ